jgi:hypothetical protein
VVEYFANKLPEFLERCASFMIEIGGRRYLDPSKATVVHHLDHSKWNADPENLALTDNRPHMIYHRNYTLARRTGDIKFFIRLWLAESGHMVKLADTIGRSNAPVNTGFPDFDFALGITEINPTGCTSEFTGFNPLLDLESILSVS